MEEEKKLTPLQNHKILCENLCKDCNNYILYEKLILCHKSDIKRKRSKNANSVRHIKERKIITFT
jgi:hypothetical protein